MDDLSIICKQTGREKSFVEEIFIKNNKDVTETICEIEGFTEIKKDKNKNLTEVQKKIEELRYIVDKKDEIMNKLINKSKGIV